MRTLLTRGCIALMAIACLPTAARPALSPLETVGEVRSLSYGEAAEARPVHLRGIVTFYDPEQQVLFIQDATGSVYLDTTVTFPIVAGSRVEVWGTTGAGYTTQVEPTRIRELSRGALPAPAVLDYEDAARHENDCRFVTLEGVVRAASRQFVGPARVYLLQMETEGHMIEVAISSFPHFEPYQLLDATVRVTGDLGGNFNASDQIVGLQLMVTDASQLQVLERPEVDPLRLPITPLGVLVRSDQALFGTTRVRTEGVVTLYDPNERLVIHEGDSDLLVQTRQMDPIAIGQHIEVTGFPSALDGSPVLENAQFMAAGNVEPVTPRDISFGEAMTGKFGNHVVALEGELISETREGHLDTLTLKSGERVFQAIFRKTAGQRDPIPLYPTGTRLRIAGVCIVHVRGFWGAVESFQIHMRSLNDISVVAPAPWWTVRRMLYATSGLLAVVLMALAWGLWMRRRLSFHEKLVRQKIESEAARAVTLAHLERQRSHILELINSFEPLPSVFTAIHVHASEMWPHVSSYSHVLQDRKLVLLACSHPSTLDTERLKLVDPTHSAEACALAVRSRSLATVSEPRCVWSRPLISSHGEILGTMTFEGKAGQPVAFHQEAFDFGCNLAAIAIDNRRLYEDALHRSQHDQLTGLANRALLDSRIEEAVERAGVSGCSAAVLFLDLDKFKTINDSYSHRVGDLYLCEVARRFQSCLRECDTLGRVGGDEFIVVIADLLDASQATTIAQRLLDTMRPPVVVEGITIQGSVSIGMAIFPDCGSNAAELKHEADAVMYEAKRAGGDQIGAGPMVMRCGV